MARTKHMTLAEFFEVYEVSQRQFAKMIGATPAQVNNWVNGRTTPHFPRAKDIERATQGEVPVDVWYPEKEEQAG